MKRLLIAALTGSLALLPATALARNAAAGDHGNQGGNGKHYGWSKQSAPATQQAPGSRDRSIEPGGSYPQGYSPSDPDGMSNGGADKPGGSGGIDKSDQDGNNGCGNDADFEDDNNGLCLGLKKHAEAAAAPIDNNALGTWEGLANGSRFALAEPLPVSARPSAAVLAEFAPAPVNASPAKTGVLAAVASVPSDVGHAVGTSVRGLLPLTGGPVGLFAALGALLLAIGYGAIRTTRRTRIA